MGHMDWWSWIKRKHLARLGGLRSECGDLLIGHLKHQSVHVSPKMMLRSLRFFWTLPEHRALWSRVGFTGNDSSGRSVNRVLTRDQKIS